MARPVSQGGIDYPDGGFASGQGGYPMIGDLAELAARTDSIVTYDRRGTVIWMTDFEYGLQGSEFGVDHEDSEGRVTSTRAYHGGFSLMFNPREVANSYVNWGRVIHFLLTGKVGVEIALCTDADPDAVRLEMYYRDGERALYGLIHYQTTGGYWKIYDENLGWVTVLEGYNLQQGPGAWHNIKLVVDTEAKEYVRLLVDNQALDLSDYLLKDDPDTSLGQLEFRVTVYGSETQHAAGYVDNVIVTQNEG